MPRFGGCQPGFEAVLQRRPYEVNMKIKTQDVTHTTPPVAFIHIPRTGGVSLVHALSDAWPGQVADLYGASDADPGPVLQYLKRPAAKSILMFDGHYSFGIHEWFPAPTYLYVSLVRDPVARIVSLYRKMGVFRIRLRTALRLETRIKAPGPAKDALLRLFLPGCFPDIYQDFADWILGRDTLDAFLDCPSPELDNGMVRRFSGIGLQPQRCSSDALEKAKENIESQFAAVGVLEHFAETLELFRIVLGLNSLSFHHDNGSWPPRAIARPIVAHVIDRIQDMNQLDTALFNWATGRFLKQIQNPTAHGIAVATASRKPAGRIPLWRSVGSLGVSKIVVGSCATPTQHLG